MTYKSKFIFSRLNVEYSTEYVEYSTLMWFGFICRMKWNSRRREKSRRRTFFDKSNEFRELSPRLLHCASANAKTHAKWRIVKCKKSIPQSLRPIWPFLMILTMWKMWKTIVITTIRVLPMKKMNKLNKNIMKNWPQMMKLIAKVRRNF